MTLNFNCKTNNSLNSFFVYLHVLARKHEINSPLWAQKQAAKMLFSEIIGQNDIKQRLIRSVSEQRIPHAQLFMGPEGIGKLALALAYARYIACLNRSETDACGTCSACTKFNKLAHPDLHFVFPVIKPKSKSSVVCDDFIKEFREMTLRSPYFSAQQWFAKISDDAKQGMIYANESQEIMRKLSLKTYESEYKIMIIWLPEKMNETCSNKLLENTGRAAC
jgi:DNA polymerase III subunit delta'